MNGLQQPSSLPRPVILLHTKGNTGEGRKNLPDDITRELYKELLDRTDGSLIHLDWDNRVPRLASHRVRHLDTLGACPTEVLLALLAHADLMIGVDSGPLHAARFTDIPTVGLGCSEVGLDTGNRPEWNHTNRSSFYKPEA